MPWPAGQKEHQINAKKEQFVSELPFREIGATLKESAKARKYQKVLTIKVAVSDDQQKKL
jgi:hypothetical protein